MSEQIKFDVLDEDDVNTLIESYLNNDVDFSEFIDVYDLADKVQENLDISFDIDEIEEGELTVKLDTIIDRLDREESKLSEFCEHATEVGDGLSELVVRHDRIVRGFEERISELEALVNRPSVFSRLFARIKDKIVSFFPAEKEEDFPF